MKWFRQLQLLLWKNVRLQIRDLRSTLITLFAPFLFILILFLSQKALESQDLFGDFYKNVPAPTPKTIAKVPHCIPRETDSCFTFAYAPTGDAFVESVVDLIIADNSLDRSEVLGIPTAEAMDSYLFANPNVTQIGVVFTLDPEPSPVFSSLACYPALNTMVSRVLGNATVWSFLDLAGNTSCGVPAPPSPFQQACTCTEALCQAACLFCYNGTCWLDYAKLSPDSLATRQWTYYVQRNQTYNFAHSNLIQYQDYVLIPFVHSIEKSLLQLAFQQNGLVFDPAAYNITYNDFPHREFLAINVIGSDGPLWFFAAIMFNFVTGVSMITSEKEMKLRAIMKTMGLYDSAYWTSWFITLGVMNSLTVIILIISGCIFQFDFFFKNAFGLYFFALELFAISMVPVAFLLSTLISRATNATKAGFLVFVLGLVTSIAASTLYNDTTTNFIIITLNLLSPALINLALSILGTATQTDDSVGLSWADRDIQYQGVMSFNQLYGWLILDFFIYLAIALYLDNVRKSEYGTKRPFYYFLTPSYWTGKSSPRNHSPPQSLPDPDNIDEDVKQERKDVKKGKLPDDTVVQIEGLSKVFGRREKKFVAVDDLYLSIQKDTLFCLLGPNGAGKTTTIHMLAGFHEPTMGDATVFGRSIVHELDGVQSFMGFCPQFDILWHDLTGEEHLRLFAGLRGLEDVEAEVDRLLEEVELTDARKQLASTYSGGMRRRLSVAIALIGSPKIVFLDEPTTGMDPVSRRAVWNIIERAKKDKVIILTTHSMEEADILSDRIGIMADGRLQCLGSGLHLKQKFGAGYRVVVAIQPGKSKKVVKYFEKNLAGVTADVRHDSIEFTVPRELIPDLPDLFDHFEANKDQIGATSIQLNLTTLEEVFLNVAGAALAELASSSRTARTLKDDGDDGEKSKKKPKSEDKVPPPQPLEESLAAASEVLRAEGATGYSARNQITALIRKDWSLLLTHKKTMICQLLTPVFLVLLLLLFDWLVNDIAIDAPPVPEDPFGNLTFSFNAVSLPYNESSDPLSPVDFSTVFEDVLSSAVFLELVSAGTTVLYVNEATGGGAFPGAWRTPAEAAASGLLGRFPVRPVPHLFSTFNPYSFDPVASLVAGTTDLPVEFTEVPSLDEMQTLLYDAHKDGRPRYSSGLHVKQIDYNSSTFEIVIHYNFSLCRGEDVPFLHSRVTESIALGLPSPIVIRMTGIKTFPTLASEGFILDLSSLAGSFFYVIILLLSVPTFLGSLTYEKETRVREMMAMMGLKTPYYFLVHYVFSYVQYFIISMLLIIIGVIVQFRVFTINNFYSYFILFFLWGHTMLAMVFLISSFIDRRQTGLIVGYFIVFGTALIGNAFVEQVISAESSSPVGANLVSLIPPFALYRGLGYLGQEVAFEGPGFNPDGIGLNDPFAPLGTVYIFLVCEWAFMLLLWAYLEQVVPSEWGVKRHPLFCFGRRFKELEHDEEDELEQPLPDDVAAMKKDVTGKKAKKNFPLRILGLSKIFGNKKSRKIAVRPTYIGVRSNETLGVLGHNGAGKTTLISMLIGLVKPTDGTAKVYGYDLRQEMPKIHQQIGICPQHDILWETLTALQHLQFYGRIRGIPRALLEQHAWDLLRAVNLASAQLKGKTAGQFSGGMKRRLAVAIAVLGAPNVIFLDEPSTGLDPKSRQDLWAVIQAAKQTSTLFLTTHSMEEADAISDRIIIMSEGSVKCVGSSADLKARFGDGFKLSIHIDRRKIAKYEKKLVKFVKKTFEGAQLINSLAGMLDFQLVGFLELGKAFATMERAKEQFAISDWAITNPTLEEVFLKITHH